MYFCTASQEESEPTLATLKAIEHPIAQIAQTIVNICANAGTGNVLKIQELLYICSEHAAEKKDEKKEDTAAEGEGESPVASSEVPGAIPAAGPPAPPTAAGVPGTDIEGDVDMSDVAAEAGAPDGGAQTAATTGEESEKEKEVEKEVKTAEQLKHQAFATLGIALIAMGEDVGAEMALRQFQHLVSVLILTPETLEWMLMI